MSAVNQSGFVILFRLVATILGSIGVTLALALLGMGSLLLLAGDAGAGAPSFDALACDPIFGCNDPEGILIFDEGALSGQVSGLRDDNSSQQCGQGVSCKGVGADATSDFVNFASVWGGGAGRERYATVRKTARAGSLILIVAKSEETDQMFCRFRADGDPASHEACSSDDAHGNSCVSTLGSDGISARGLVIEITDPRACAPGPAPCWEYVIARGYVGCNLAIPAAITLASATRREIPEGSRVGAYKYDEVHHSGAAAMWTVDALLSRPLDVEFTPRASLLENGFAERDCSTGSSKCAGVSAIAG